MPGEKDIIDEAMKMDDFDYGDQDTSSETNTSGADQQPNDGQQQPAPLTGEQQIVEPQQNKQEPLQQPNAPAQQPGRPTGPQVPQPSAENPNGFRRVGAQFADGKGNIVDKTGKIIAAAGESARLWQEASRATAQVNNLTRQNEQMQRQLQDANQVLQQAREISEMPQKMGISKEDFNEGMTLMSRWRSNPVEVAREVVARTLSFGYNVSDILGKSAGDALETKAIARMVQDATAPVRQQQEQAARQQQNERAAEQAYSQFITRYPDAETHGEQIASIMNRKQVNATEAYFMVKEFALNNGLDFSQPLGPQIASRQHAPQQQQVQRHNTGPAPMVNGGRVENNQLTTDPAMADANDDWGTILNGVLKQT